MSVEKVLLSIDTDLLNRLDARVESIGMGATRSGVISAAIKSFIKKKEGKQ